MSVDVLEINRVRAGTQTVAANAAAQELAANAALGLVTEGRRMGYATDPSMWDAIFPAAPTGGTVLCVYDTSGQFRAGACCLWTVPAGVTVAKFEIWGAGGGTIIGCCCAFSPFGATGAYATTCIPVVAGCQYTLCAGCAFCCYPLWTTTGCHGCASYVTGFNLCNFCAMGGTRGDLRCQQREASWWVDPCAAGCVYNPTGLSCCYPNAQGTANSFITCSTECARNVGNAPYYPCICSYGETCFSTSGASPGLVPTRLSTCRTFYGTACNHIANTLVQVFGVPSQMGEYCYCNCCLVGYIKHPPIPGFVNTSQCQVSFSVSTVGGSCCNPSTGYLNVPGAGGVGGTMAAGCTDRCGDSGRTGMVRVTYC